MQELVNGIKKFQDQAYPGLAQHFDGLAKGQSPHTLLVTCADSRIDNGLFMQSLPGEVFVLRNAGNIVPSYTEASGGEIASIEFGVRALGVKNIVICGHSQCGAMKGLLAPEGLDALPAVKAWLSHSQSARSAILDHYSSHQGEELLDLTIQMNLLNQIENLKTHPAVAEGLEQGKLNLFAWVYQFEKGQVFGFDEASGTFTPVTQSMSPISQTKNNRSLTPILGGQQ